MKVFLDVVDTYTHMTLDTQAEEILTPKSPAQDLIRRKRVYGVAITTLNGQKDWITINLHRFKPVRNNSIA